MQIEKYFKRIEEKVLEVYAVAEEARKKGLDPRQNVEIPLAKSLAERAVGLVSVLYPQVKDEKIVNRISELEKQFGKLDPAVCLSIAEEIAKEKFCKFRNLLEAIDAGIRVAFAYYTLGVVVVPLEGYTHMELKKTKEGKDYFCAYYSGPIRSAGTTASSFSLVIIDYLRSKFGFAKYDPSETEIKRIITEIYDYHERITNLQYLANEKELDFLLRHLPIQIDGLPSEEKEVSNYKDLERVETNRLRNGVCLVLSEGIAQKAAKVLRFIKKLKLQGFELNDWDFLEEYVVLQKKIRDIQKSKEDAEAYYIKDLVAGRPVFSHPSRSGGFRLRYGRARTSGFSCMALHPATMAITDDFLAVGTQIKTERPTKGAAIASCDSIDGPIVKLKDGSVLKIKTLEKAREIYKEAEEIIYIGDVLVPYADFLNRNAQLEPAGYVEEYWKAELKEKLDDLKRELKEEDEINKKIIDELKEINCYDLRFEKAIELSEKYNLALHPEYIFFWTQISEEEFLGLLDWLSNGKLNGKIILPYSKIDRERFIKGKRALELLGVEHQVTLENVVIDKKNAVSLLVNLGIDEKIIEKEDYSIEIEIEEIARKIKNELDKEKEANKEKVENKEEKSEKNVLDLINKLAKFKIKDKAGTFIGARMGRPEKAKLRKLTGSPSVLFPVGYEGGRLRSVQAACEVGSVKADFPLYFCEACNKEAIYPLCEACGSECRKLNYCPKCQQIFQQEKCPEHGIGQGYSGKRIDIKKYFDCAIKKLKLEKEEIPPLIKGVRGTSSKNHIHENLAKGFLRSMFNLHVNKDGTIRYDATELPITHFKAREIGTSIEKLKEMGYTKDIYDKELENEEQILEIYPHDIILPAYQEEEPSDKVFMNVAKFMDNLLLRFYEIEPFYNLDKKEDLAGQLVVFISPHNAAGVIGRIIGFSKNQAFLASPYMHAGVRRDCLDYGSYVSVERNGEWQIEKIGKIIDELNPDEKADNFGTLKKEILNLNTFSNPGESKVTEVTKHAPRKMLKLFLEDGRKIELTENHRVYLKGKKEKEAREIEVGEKLIVSYRKEIQEKDIPELFLPEIFQEREDIMIRNVREFLSCFEKIDKGSNFYQRDSFPIKFVKEFLGRHNKILYDLPNDAKIAIKRDNVFIPINIPLDKELLEIFGLYIAEGHARKNESKKGFYQISIASADKKIREFIKKIFYLYFNLKPSEDHIDHVTFSSRIIYELFKNYLKMGSRAREKRIPNLFLDLKKEKLACLLRGYFEGDGSVSLTDTRVACDTVSEGLKQDLSFVLSRFEIFTKFYEYEKEPGPIVREFYLRKNRKIPKFKITKIIIPSNFVKKFKEIGFLSEKKSNILGVLCKKTPMGMRIDLDENYVYPKVVKIENIGEKESYCFNVQEEHNFFCNDILVHNCDGDESAVLLLLDCLINFSKEYLPDHRGATQDAPLVLNMKLNPGEVDDQIFDFDIIKELPVELYKAAEKREHSSSVVEKMELIKHRIIKGEPAFKNLWYSHEVSDINNAVLCSSYKNIPTMQEKVQRQMQLVEKIRAADTGDTARLIIDRHLMRDIKGNLRKFSTQGFRCVMCNEKFRRPPLQGNCPRCKGKIIFTVSEGGIVKYLEPALQLAKNYDVPAYIRQDLELTKRYIESIFGREETKQTDLKQWF